MQDELVVKEGSSEDVGIKKINRVLSGIISDIQHSDPERYERAIDLLDGDGNNGRERRRQRDIKEA